MHYFIFRSALLFSLIAYALLPTHSVFAQTSSVTPIPTQSLQVQGLAVSPFLIEAQIEPGKASDHTITLTNTTDKPLPITFSINDFIPNGSTGQAKFLNADEKGNPAYSISSWISIVKQPALTIEPGKQTEVIFRIQPPVDADPGTHYGGLLFSYRTEPAASGSVAVEEKVAVLVLGQFGNGNERGTITRLIAEQHGKNEVLFLLSFYNQGNVHLKPKGEIHISNMVGGQVATVPVNRDANIVLPETDRLFQTTWDSGWRFGRYTATAVLYYGDPKIEVRSTTVLWIVPWERGVVLFLGLIIGLYLFRRFMLWHRRRLELHIQKKNGVI